MTETKTTCPHCGSEDVKPILYGMPTEEAALSGEWVLGGCCVAPGESPSHRCETCGKDFGVVEDA